MLAEIPDANEISHHAELAMKQACLAVSNRQRNVSSIDGATSIVLPSLRRYEPI
jgi:hypothetical protein